MPYLCDPSGMMSRTETELLDRQIQRLLHGQNVSGCICPSYPTQFTGIKEYHYLQKSNPSTPHPDSCRMNVNKQKQLINIAIILVPFSSIERYVFLV